MDEKSITVIGRNALWSILNQSAAQILSLLVFLVTARFVSKEAFGTIAVAMLVVEFFRQVMVESVGISLAAKKDPRHEDYNAGFVIIIAGSILSAALMYLLAHPAAIIMKIPDLEIALQMTSIVVLSMGLSRVHETWMAKNMKFKILAIRSIVAIGIGGAVGIIMAINGYGLTSLIVQQVLTSILGVLFLWACSSWRPNLRAKWQDIKDQISYARHVSMNAVAGVAGTQSDTFFSAYFLGPAATGVYNASKRILVATQMTIAAGLNSIALPLFSDVSDDAQVLKNMYLKAVASTALITAPLYIGLTFLSHDIIAIILGDKWIDAAPILSILCVSAFVASIDQYNTNIYLVCKKPQWRTFLTIFNAILNVFAFIVAARHGLHALAFTFVAIKLFVMFPISLRLSSSLINVRIGEYIAVLFPILTSALLMGVGIYTLQCILTELHTLLNVVIIVPTGFGLYVSALYILDKNLFKQICGLVLSLISKKKNAL